jgi:hypothetical protein
VTSDSSTNSRTPDDEISEMTHFRTEKPSSGRIQAGEPILRREAFLAPLVIAAIPIALAIPLRASRAT